jgi:dihydroorotate dehydrogenase electron transfer subunit
MMAIQVDGEVVAMRRVGAYFHLSFTAQGIPEQTRPGHFVALSVGGPTSANLLRRAFSVHRVNERGLYGGTVDIVFAAHGVGTQWLSSLERGAALNVVGPLGRPFALPREPVGCILVGGGYGAAPLAMLAEQLQQRGCRVDVVLGAASSDRLFGVLDARRSASSVVVTTDDGTAGERGRVTDVLPELIQRTGADVVYACGPMGMLAAISGICDELGVHSQCAVEESMACGVGVCMTCVLPVIGDDGVTRMVRSCVEGPVFRGERVRWSDVGSMPDDILGAPQVVN